MTGLVNGESVLVIAVLRIRDYSNKECEPYWEFASYDQYAGSFSSGYPCFDNNLVHAITFKNVADAEDRFKRWWKDYVLGHSGYDRSYDMSTLCIKELKLETVSEKHLTVN